MNSPQIAPPDQIEIPLEELIFLNDRKVVSRNFQISMTFRCGNRCLFCPVALTGEELSGEAAARALEDYARKYPRRMSGTELILTGGEPTLSKSLLKTARLGRSLGFQSITVLSSAAGFADMSFARDAHAAGIRRLFLSLHSHREEVHDLLTGTHRQFRRAVQGLSNSLTLPFSQVTCNMVINRHNYRDIPDHAAFLGKLAARVKARTPLALSLSVLEENPRWDSLCVPHADVAPYVRRAVEEAAVPIARFIGNWTMPACIGGLAAAAPSLRPEARWDTPAWYAPDAWTPATSEPPAKFTRVKARRCRACSLDGVCAGLSRTYAGYYGVSELMPVAGKAPAATRRKRIHIA